MAAGRPLGSSNKNKHRLLSGLQAEYGEDFNPVMQMAKNAHLMQQEIDSTDETSQFTYLDAINAWGQIASFTNAKMKAIELTGPDGDVLRGSVSFDTHVQS